MPALPFSPVDLAPAFPDVAWAIGIALMLAIVTFRAPKPAAPPTLEAMGADHDIQAETVEDGDDP